jgi:hypothetical protein
MDFHDVTEYFYETPSSHFNLLKPSSSFVYHQV